jgi:ribose transport system substrate-binding protein
MNQRPRFLWLVCVAVIALMATTGVYAGGSAESEGSDETTLGIAIRTLTNPYQANYQVGADMYADHVGLPAVTLTSEGSSEKQVNDIRSLVARTNGDVVFMIDPNEATDVVPIARTLEEAGVYYVTWWNKPPEIKVWDYPHWVSHIAYDGISAGYFTATELFETFDSPGEGRILALQGMLANSIAQDRFDGLHQALEENPGVELVAYEAADWDRTKAFEKTKNMLAANPDIDGIWAANDNMALGALEALREVGLAGKVLVTGCDGVEEIFDAILAGEAAATVYNDSKYQAGIGLAIALAAKNGEIDVEALSNEKRQFFADAVNVNQSNVQDVIDTYVEGAPEYDYSDHFGAWVRAME